jgi:hypothetical protein
MFRPSDRILADGRSASGQRRCHILQEVSRVNLAMLTTSATCIHQLVCDAHSVGAVAVLRRARHCCRRNLCPCAWYCVGCYGCARDFGAKSYRCIYITVICNKTTIALIEEIPQLESGVTVIGGISHGCFGANVDGFEQPPRPRGSVGCERLICSVILGHRSCVGDRWRRSVRPPVRSLVWSHRSRFSAPRLTPHKCIVSGDMSSS